ncbi:ABC transporter ATP-binding protein [Candidatus Woesearchaeota archaeon]|nr:ABC transporter ATP-binding protein [Candidatus Woesearchaeota archaeon]MCF7901269.1 ABC transporter ATP-binding protein [Candidatus Woesearchaeota archaeon]MCF8013564.1 ABC transporter ATP-binding protein [Candidatus Woesearchaeota archaeon]
MYLSERRPPILEFKNIVKRFGNNDVLKGINFNVEEGALFGLIGRSGAGKTTLLRTLIGYYETDEGQIFYKGRNIAKSLKEIRTIFGFTTQDSCFYEELSLADNMEYFGKMYGLSKEQIKFKTEELLKLVELWDSKDIRAQDLSGGMKRRLDMAISLVHEPKVLILDEPTTGLDPLLRKGIWSLIKKVNNKGVTIIMSSHLLDEMEYLCTSVAMIKAGKLLIKGTPKQLKSFYSKNQEVKLESYPGNYKLILQEYKKQNIQIYYPRHEITKLIFYTPNTTAILNATPNIMLKLKEALSEISIEKPNLNEVFEAFSRYN